MISSIWNILITWTFLMSLAFVIYYHIVANWRINAFGRSLMVYQVAMTAVLGFTTYESLFRKATPVPVQIFEMSVLAVVPFALTWRLVVLIRTRREINGSVGQIDDTGHGAPVSERITLMFATVKKALAGALVGAGSALATALSDGSISTADVSLIVAGAVGGFVLVWLAPKNVDKKGSADKSGGQA